MLRHGSPQRSLALRRRRCEAAPSTPVREVPPAERPRGDPVAGPPPADGGRQPLVPRRRGERGAGPHRLRAPLRAHDVHGHEARRRGALPTSCSKPPAAADSTRRPSFDRTNYFETVPSNQLELALWPHADRMGYLLDALDQTALANQQDVVRNERRQSIENRPVRHRRRGDLPRALSARSSVPPVRSSDRTPTSRPRSSTTCATSSSATTARTTRRSSIVGDFDPAAAKRLVEKYFGSFKRGADVPKPTVRTPPITASAGSTSPTRSSSSALDLGVAHAAVLQARRRRARRSPRTSSPAASRAGSTRSSCTRSRSRRTSAPIRTRTR